MKDAGGLRGDGGHGEVVVGVDGHESTAAALAYSVHAARSRRAGLVVLHAYRPLHGGPDAMLLAFDDPQRLAEETLQLAVDLATDLSHGDVPVEGRLVRGPTTRVLVDGSRHAGLLVVGRDRISFVDPWIHAVATRSAARAAVPVAVVPDSWRSADAEGPVVVGVDTAVPSEELLRTALGYAAAERRPLRVLHVRSARRAARRAAPAGVGGGPAWSAAESSDESELERMLTDAVSAFPGVTVHLELVTGLGEVVLAEAARDAAVIVLGRHDAALPIGPRLGSVTTHVMRTAACPVVVVPHR